MRDAAKQILQQVANFLNSDVSDAAKHELWDVLAALRGPDLENNSIKNATTAVIRNALGIRRGFGYSVNTNPDCNTYVAIRLNTFNGCHFHNHVAEAFHALGLKWDQLNPDVNILTGEKQS